MKEFHVNIEGAPQHVTMTLRLMGGEDLSGPHITGYLDFEIAEPSAFRTTLRHLGFRFEEEIWGADFYLYKED